MTAAAKIWRLLAAVGVFGVAGPPVGGLVAWATMGARSLRSPLPFVTDSYREGAVLAVAAGLLIAAVALWLGRVPWGAPVVVAILVTAAMLALSALTDPARPDLLASLGRMAGVFFLPSLVACVVCWLLTRRLLRFG